MYTDHFYRRGILNMAQKKKLALSTQIFIALVLAIAAGIALTGNPDFASNYIKPFGTIFLNLIKWIVCPLVFFSIMSGVVSMRDIRKVGSQVFRTVRGRGLGRTVSSSSSMTGRT